MELLNTQRPEGQGKCPHPHPALLTAGKGPQAAGISISAAGPGWLCLRLATSQSSPRCAAGHRQEHRAAAVMAVSSQQCGMGGRLRALSGTVLRGRVRTGRGSSSSSAALGELAAANGAAPLEALLLPQACEDGQYGNGPVNNQNVEVKQKLTTNSDWRRQSGTLQALKTTTCMRHRLRKNKTKPTKTKPHNTVRTSNFSGRWGSSTPGISRCRPLRQDKHSTSSRADLPKDSTLLSTTSPVRPSAWAPHHSVPAGQNGQEATERFYSTAYEV